MRFTIKQGQHYHSNQLARLLLLTKTKEHTSIQAKIMFSEDCWYPKSYVSNNGYNKLFGSGGIAHQINSARFVWKPNFEQNGKFDIYAYTYTSGIWTDKYITTVGVGQWVEYHVDNTSHAGYTYLCNGVQVVVFHKNPEMNKILQPYFGGKDTAYRSMNIYIKNIK